MTVWLNIVGVTEMGTGALAPAMRTLVDDAQVLIGPERLLPAPAPVHQRVLPWQAPLSAMIEQVMALRGQPTVILATGDPNWFGIGATLGKHLEQAEFALHPATSAFQLAAARMHWVLQNVETISLHGRDVSLLQPHLHPGARILALTSDRKTLPQVAAVLEARGYAQSRLTVLENLGGPDEKQTECAAAEASQQQIGDFYTLAIDCVANAQTMLLPVIPGLPDAAFVSDGQLTKQEVRAATLAKLAPYSGALLWDVGAGCGSVAIEWMRAASGARALAFEKNEKRVAMIEQNREALGVPSLQVVTGQAPDAFDQSPAPDAIFLGGDVANETLFSACWSALKPNGRLVANAVTLDGERALFDRQARWGGELSRIQVSVLDHIGDERVFRPRMAVTQWSVAKGAA